MLDADGENLTRRWRKCRNADCRVHLRADRPDPRRRIGELCDAGRSGIAEPKATVFAGPRVIEQTSREKPLPGFQRSG